MPDRPPLRVVTNSESDTPRARLRILVADDDRDTTLTLATILGEEGYEVHTILRGDEVMALCRYLRPDVVIADVDMPGMSGYAVARELRERHGSLAPLLIAVSGKWTKESDRMLGQAVGFDHYLLKPAEPRELLAILQRFSASVTGQQRQRGEQS